MDKALGTQAFCFNDCGFESHQSQDFFPVFYHPKCSNFTKIITTNVLQEFWSEIDFLSQLCEFWPLWFVVLHKDSKIALRLNEALIARSRQVPEGFSSKMRGWNLLIAIYQTYFKESKYKLHYQNPIFLPFPKRYNTYMLSLKLTKLFSFNWVLILHISY